MQSRDPRLHPCARMWQTRRDRDPAEHREGYALFLNVNELRFRLGEAIFYIYIYVHGAG